MLVVYEYRKVGTPSFTHFTADTIFRRIHFHRYAEFALDVIFQQQCPGGAAVHTETASLTVLSDQLNNVLFFGRLLLLPGFQRIQIDFFLVFVHEITPVVQVLMVYF